MEEKVRYQILIIWGDVEPELNPVIYDSYNEVVAQAKRIREQEGDKHGIYYIKWNTSIDIDPAIYFQQWKDGRDSNLSVNSFGAAELEDFDE